MSTDYFRLAELARFLVERVAVLRAAGFLAVDLAATRFFADFFAVVRFAVVLLLEAAFFLVALLRFLADLEAVARLVDFFAVAFFAVDFFLAAPVRVLADFLAVVRVVGFFAADFFAVLRVVVLVAISVGSFVETNWVHDVFAPPRQHPIRDVCEHVHLPLVSMMNVAIKRLRSFNTARLIVPSVALVNWKLFNINLLATLPIA